MRHGDGRCRARDDHPGAGRAAEVAAVRNMSDPQINGDLPTDCRVDLQTEFAVAYYTSYGYHTSVAGAFATWGVLAGLATAGLPT